MLLGDEPSEKCFYSYPCKISESIIFRIYYYYYSFFFKPIVSPAVLMVSFCGVCLVGEWKF